MAATSDSTFIVADDHPLFREAMIQAVRNCVDGAGVVEAESLETLQQAVEANPEADLLLLDLNMPGVNGFSALAWIRSTCPTLPTVIVSASDDPAIIRRAVGHGASGFIPKSSPIARIEAAINAVLEGEVWLPEDVTLDEAVVGGEEADVAASLAELTPHQFRVLLMLAEGLMNKQIAWELGVSEATVKAHVTAILRKLRVTNRTQAVLAMQKLTLVD